MFSTVLALLGTGVWPLAATPVPQNAKTVENTPVPTALIAGVVVDGATGRPIPGALVNVNANRIPGVLADPLGRFIFPAIPAGVYVLTAAKGGYAAAEGPAPDYRVTAADGQRVLDVRMKLWRLASISGTVTDERGDPVVRAQVYAFRWLANGDASTPTRTASVFTDDRGLYRLFQLPPADYVVAAGRKDLPSIGEIATLSASTSAVVAPRSQAQTAPTPVELMDASATVLPPRFHPDAPSFRDATTLRLSPGDERTGIDIMLAPRRVVPVSGVIGGEVERLTLRADDFHLTPIVDGEPVPGLASYVLESFQPQGGFTFKAVPHGNYLLTATSIANVETAPTGRRRVDAADQLPYWASLPVTVAGDGVAGLQLVIRPGVRVSGQTTFVGVTPPAAAAMESFRLTFWPLTGLGQLGAARVAADGSFSAVGLVPGGYTAEIQSDASLLHVKTFVAGGVDVTDLPFVVGSEPIGNVQVTLAGAGDYASITGSVRQLPGAQDDVAVFLFPADRRFWSDPRAAGRRFKSTVAKANGAFEFSSLMPGEYLVVASTDPVTSNWRSTARLDALSRLAERIVLMSGEARVITVAR